MSTRRQFLQRASLASAAAVAIPISACNRPDLPTPPTQDANDLARNENYWRQVAAQYDVTDEITNLEAGFWGIMAAPVLQAFKRHTDRVNHENSFFARTQFNRQASEIRDRVAAALGIKPGEVVFSRNATEALQALIGQYNRLEAGETVMYADLDYPSMRQAMDGLAGRRRANVARLIIPEPAVSVEQIVAAYEEALDAHPKTRLLLLTHANNQTGLIHPVREITALARARVASTLSSTLHTPGVTSHSIFLISGRITSDSISTNGSGPPSVSVPWLSASGGSQQSTAHTETPEALTRSAAACTRAP